MTAAERHQPAFAFQVLFWHSSKHQSAMFRVPDACRWLQVDAAIQLHPDVAEAAAFAVSESMLGQVAEAAVVLRPQSKLTAEEAPLVLRKFAADRLEDFKVRLSSTPHPGPSLEEELARKARSSHAGMQCLVEICIREPADSQMLIKWMHTAGLL